MTDLPVGWQVIEATDMHGVPCYKIIIQCATEEIANKYANSILLNEKIVNRMTDKQIIQYRQDIINQDEFDKLKKHEYRKESIHDDTCLECGFPERFHQTTVQTKSPGDKKDG